METQDDTTMVMGQNSAQPGDETDRHPADDPLAPDRVVNGYTQAEFTHAALEAVLDHLPIGVVIAEVPSGRLIAGNKKIEAIWRRPLLAQLHLSEHNLWHSHHPDGRPYTAAEWPMSRAIHSGEVVRDEEIHIARGDDTWGIISMSAAPIHDRSGKVVAGVISCHDITDRKQMDEALRASEEAFKAVAENAPDLIARFDRDFRHLFVSSAIQQATGIEPEAFTGKTYREIGMPEQLCDQWDRVLQSVFDTGKRTSIEFDYPDAQGVIRTYQMHAGPEHSSDNSVRSVLTIVRDITEQKRASQILHTQYDVTRVLAETDDLSDGLRKALQIICVGVGWDLGVMWIVDRDANLLRYSTLWHSPSVDGAEYDRHSRNHFFVPGMGVPGRVWASGLPIWMSDVTADARFSRTALVTRMGQRTAVTLPVRNRNEIVAVMEFLSHEVRPPDEELTHTLSALGNQIGIFIERKRTEQSLALRVRQQASVAELGHTALTQHDIGSLMDQAVAAVAKTLGVDYAQVFELSTDGTMFLMRAGVGWEQHLIGHYTVAAHADSHTGYTLLAREPIVIEDFREETRFSGAPLLHEHNILSGMSVVVYGHGRPFGVLSVYHTTRRRFTRDDIHFLQSVANVLAAAAERQRADDVLHLSLNNTRELYTVSQRIGLANTFDDILQVLISSSYLRHSNRAEIALFDRAWVHIGEPPRGIITLAAWSSTADKQQSIPECRLVEDIAWLNKMQIRHSPLYVDDVERDQRLKEQCRSDLLGQNIRSAVIFPLVASGQPFGVISFLFEQSRAVSKSDIRYIQGLIDQAAVAIHNIRLLQTEAEARRGAEKANELKLKFLAMISHELRTPLTSIKGFATTLLADDVSWDPESQRDFIETINLEADKLTDMIEQLLDLSRMDAGTLRIHPETQPLSSVIAIAAAQLNAVAADHQLMLNVPHDLPYVNVDLQRIAQVLANLVDNAAKYSPRGSTITLMARHINNHVQVDVEDKGAGIPAQDRKRVFEAFHRGEEDQNKRTKGAGLGLAICKGLIEAHGGQIWVQETSAPGTTISFTLPAVLP